MCIHCVMKQPRAEDALAPAEERCMEFAEVLAQVIDLLAREKRLAYRALKLRFHLDDAYLAGLKEEIIDAKRLAVDEEGRVLVWTGDAGALPPPIPPALQTVHQPHALLAAPLQAASVDTAPHRPEAERRQITVMFCDVVDSTTLSSQLDPEDYREVIRAYQVTCAEVIQRFAGHIAQYLGDGLLVYFGYPQAHEDDAQRAVRTALGMVEALGTLNTGLEQDKGLRLAVRVGIHTGVVVVGEVGAGSRQEHLALGDTPNIAARLQGYAAPDTVVISAATHQLIQGYFLLHDCGTQTLRGVATPLRVYRVLGESGVQSRLDIAATRGLTPLVGREHEVGVLLECWAQVKEGMGHVVLVSGEAGIGKSRLVQVLKDRVAHTVHTRMECRCVPQYQHSALHPVVGHLARLLALSRDDLPLEKLRKLEEALAQHALPLPEMVPLVAGLLSIPLPARYPPLTLTPQRQRQKTLEALLAWLLAEAIRHPVLFIVEDLHWGDPSTLEFLSLVVEQVPAARLCALFTYRPEFQPPWLHRSHVTPLTLQRLSRPEVERLSVAVAGGKALPTEVIQQVVRKTDGVPLFVEELTKMVLETNLLREHEGHYELVGPLPPLAIPTTLHDSLMARLDRLAPVKMVAQLGATIGRQFSYELFRAVSPLDEPTLQQGLRQLIEAELVYQQGTPPQATYTFKHALIQDAAYQSLLRSTRQQYHKRIAQVLVEQFPETAETQPELLAHHYTEAGRTEQAISYWQRAGQQARQRSANPEAVQHLTMGLALLATLPETPERDQQELNLQIALGPALVAAKGRAAPEVEQVYARALELCRQVGETPQLFPTLRGLCRFYQGRGALPTARALGEQLLRLAQREDVPTPRLEAHEALGSTLFYLGDYAAAQTHLEQGVVLTDPMAQRAQALRHDVVPGVRCLAIVAWALWCLGYPAQAVQRSQEALALAQTLAHPQSLVFAQYFAAFLHHRRREAPEVQMQVDALLPLATAQEFPLYVGLGTCLRGWAAAVQGESMAGLAQMHQGMAAVLATGQTLTQPLCLVLLAEAAGHAGQVEEGLHLLAEALAALEASGRGDLLAEAYRLQGELLLRQAAPDAAQAEACCQQALAIARRQQAKSWELRAATSLARLWQQQGKRAEAHQLLAEVYGWFTEGFDTADLQEARALLDTLKKE
jgi:class 3 adenylate cyclase/predicted ATPase